MEAVPAISLSLFGGYAADRWDRRAILLITRGVSVICALLLAAISLYPTAHTVTGLYAVIFLAGIARGFADPAGTAFEAQVVPKSLTVNAASWISSAWLSCSVIGPALVGFSYDIFGAAKLTFYRAGIRRLLACTAAITPKPKPSLPDGESILKAFRSGCVLSSAAGPHRFDEPRFVRGLSAGPWPCFRSCHRHPPRRGQGPGDPQRRGRRGFTLRHAVVDAPSPIRHAGRNLLVRRGFGVSIIIFAFSKISFIHRGPDLKRALTGEHGDPPLDCASSDHMRGGSRR